MRQREQISADVMALRHAGTRVTDALRQLGVAKSTYYSWQSSVGCPNRRAVNPLLATERQAILAMKQQAPHLRHRTISGLLRHDGLWISPSSCYRVLAAEDLVEPYERREAPWTQPRYEPVAPNLLWGEDWTKLLIDGRRWYLLVLLDLFSRLIVSWSVVQTVTQRDVRELVAAGILAQGLDRTAQKPRLRTDQGSPNLAGSVKEFLTEIGVELSPGRVRRPTDNARVERLNGTIKQEEIYCQGSSGYLSPEGAKLSLGRYIAYYNHQRPHQALWGFTPAQVHRVGNKTKLLEEYRRNVAQAQQNRLRQNRLRNHVRLLTCYEKSV